MDWVRRRAEWLGAALVFLVTQFVYIRTMVISCPFWDSGEFIATTYTLGIPHPPGNPLYMVIGRFFDMLPIFPLVATRLNWLSTLGASLAAMFTYLATYELWLRARHPERRATMSEESAAAGRDLPQGADPWIPVLASLVAAFFTAFSPTFWTNGTEAETYSTSSFLMVFCVWLILRWGRAGGKTSERNGLFMLLYYLLCLSMAIYLGAPLVLPGIILFAFLVDFRFFGGTRWTAGLVAVLVVLLHPGLLPTEGIWIWGSLVVLVLLSSLLFARSWPAVSGRGLLTWCVLVGVVALSTHFYLMIRAGYHTPHIAEADPSSWPTLWKALIRDQYKPPNPFFERQGSWSSQLGHHFWRYMRNQYDLGLRPEWLGWYLPYLLGLVGIVWQYRREKKGFVLLAVNYVVMTLGLVFYLNFKLDEVRDRDYFFVGAFQFYPVWIGLGAGVLLEGLQQSLQDRRWAYGAGVVTVCLPFLTCSHNWFEHNRHEFYIARDFAYNMLVPLKPDAIIFTNGDNDTFPLWYLQEVEGLRRDVRVANLSLLNTDWYMRQLRDLSRKIDLGWNNSQIDNATAFSSYMEAYTRGYIGRDDLQRFLDDSGLKPYVRSFNAHLLAKDVAVARIVEREYGKRPLYLALTVPDQMGLEKRLVQEGIVFEIEDAGKEDERIDLDATVHNLQDVYRYRGLLKADGTFDAGVAKDDNAMKLVQNYSAAYIEAAREEMRLNRVPDADALLAKAVALAPDAPAIQYSIAMLKMDMGRWSDAESILRKVLDQGQVDYRLFCVLGQAQEAQGHLEEAEGSYRRAQVVSPGSFDPYRYLFSLFWQTKKDPTAALQVLDSWLQQHPDDQKVRRARQVYADSAALLGAKH